jgi:HJR/Mrr/RecB family endonuclease
MQPTDALPSVNLKGFLRYVAGLLNRCPHWVASLTPDQGYLIAQSPTGLRYLIQLVAQTPTHEGALQAVLTAQQTHRADRALLIAVNGQYGPLFRELARASGVHLWTLEEVDYLIMAADLESNTPLAYLGLEVRQPKTTLAPHPAAVRQATQGF